MGLVNKSSNRNYMRQLKIGIHKYQIQSDSNPDIRIGKHMSVGWKSEGEWYVSVGWKREGEW
jgi:hypothetical protein